MTETETVGDTDIQYLEEMLNKDREPCGFEDCDHPAAWFLLCPADRSAETVCSQHRLVLMRWPEQYPIRFNLTCNHNVPIGECLWEPYTG